MGRLDFLTFLPRTLRPDYLSRMTDYPKAEAIRRAKQYGFDYWDGDRRFGFGGYRDDGRWHPVAEAMARHYNLRSGDRVLDVGCGKAFLLKELTRVVPGLSVAGLDISPYSLEQATPEMRPFLTLGAAEELPYFDNSFDLVLCLNTLHNLYCQDLDRALRELVRVGRKNWYVTAESYRTEEEKVNLLCWTLTGECFFTPEEWLWWFDLTGFTGDHEFVFFE